jgi:hypothetical protein
VSVAGIGDQGVLALPSAYHALRGEQLDHGLDVPDPGHVVQGHGSIGEQGGREDGQRSILVSGGAEGTAEAVPAVDNETRHGADVTRWRIRGQVD